MKRMIIAAVMMLSLVVSTFNVTAFAAEKDVKEIEMKRTVYVSAQTSSEIKSLQKDIISQSDKIEDLKSKRLKLVKKIKSEEAEKPVCQTGIVMRNNIPFASSFPETLPAFNFSYRQIDTDTVKEVLKAERIDKKIRNLEKEKLRVIQKIDMNKQVLSQMKIDLRELNSLDGVVFNPNDVTELSNISVKQMRQILQDTDLQEFAPVYVKIEREFHINAIAICALSALESGWGTSKRAKEDHNYTGFGVYSNEAEGINAASGEENLLMTAKHIRSEYLTKGARYDNGPSLIGINTMYCVGDTWAYKIADIGYRLMAKLANNNFSVQ